MISLVLATLIGVLAIYSALCWWRSRSRKYNYNLPKGPVRIPFLGNLNMSNAHIRLSQWAEEYGSLYTVYLGTKPALVFSDVRYQKEMFNQQVATGKFKSGTPLLLVRGEYGIINTEGPAWAEQRQFCLRNLVQFGFGNKRLEPLILSDCQDLIQIIKEKTENANGRGIEINQILKLATNNTLMAMVTGERVGLEDKTVADLIENFSQSCETTVKTGLGIYPWLKHIIPGISGYKALDEATAKLFQYFENIFDNHRDTSMSRDKDLIDSYVEKVEKTSDTASSFYGEVGKANSVSSVVELFLAGTETTSATIAWLLYYVALHPNVQDKLHEELDRVLGGKNGRDPSLEDKSLLVYTRAVILEAMRIRPVSPMGIIHELLSDLEYNGYLLPKGMLLIANIYHCHHDKTVWKDPENFRPERFLTGDNDIDNKLKDLVVPFQVGKRNCLGEPLAKDIIFLFVTKLLHAFDIKPVHGISADEYLKQNLGQILAPYQRKVWFKSRLM